MGGGGYLTEKKSSDHHPFSRPKQVFPTIKPVVLKTII